MIIRLPVADRFLSVERFLKFFSALLQKITLAIMYPIGYNSTMYIILKTEYFDKWILKLKDIRAKAKILTRLKKVELGNLGNYKSIGGKISEMRIDYGPGYRIYFTISKRTIIVLLTGGDKSSQSVDIKKARKILSEIGG